MFRSSWTYGLGSTTWTAPPRRWFTTPVNCRFSDWKLKQKKDAILQVHRSENYIVFPFSKKIQIDGPPLVIKPDWKAFSKWRFEWKNMKKNLWVGFSNGHIWYLFDWRVGVTEAFRKLRKSCCLFFWPGSFEMVNTQHVFKAQPVPIDVILIRQGLS